MRSASANVSRLARVAKAYKTHVVDIDREARLLATAAFLLTFVAARLATHYLLADKGGGGIQIGSLHVHHVVFGIVLLLVFGLLVIVDVIERLRAVVFGVGAALVLDEFAVVLNLADVYWAPQGRESIDVVVIFAWGRASWDPDARQNDIETSARAERSKQLPKNGSVPL